MKRILMFFVAVLLAASYSVQAEDEAADPPPDPVPGATKPVREQNLDANEWIAVHEQGTANVEVQNDETNPIPVDANITGGSIEAEITGGEVEVTNEVTVKFPAGETIDVNIVANLSTLPWEQGFLLSSELFAAKCKNVYLGNDGPINITSVTCWAESDHFRIGEDLVIGLYNDGGNTGLNHLRQGPPDDICAPFSRSYSDGSILTPTYRAYCKSNSSWTTFEDYLYLCLEGQPGIPVPKAMCSVHGTVILQ